MKPEDKSCGREGQQQQRDGNDNEGGSSSSVKGFLGQAITNYWPIRRPFSREDSVDTDGGSSAVPSLASSLEDDDGDCLIHPPGAGSDTFHLGPLTKLTAARSLSAIRKFHAEAEEIANRKRGESSGVDYRCGEFTYGIHVRELRMVGGEKPKGKGVERYTAGLKNHPQKNDDKIDNDDKK